MSLIEGMGDEVPIFFVLAAIVIVAFMVLAWKSTDVPELSFPSPVLTFTLTQREIPAASELVVNEDRPRLTPEENVLNQDIPSPPNPDLISSHQATTMGSDTQPANGDSETVAETTSEAVSEDKSSELRERQTDASRSEAATIISVKLKYMNDTHRVVESLINSTIGDFKRTHFKKELNENKVVKLIFNGQVLSDESSLLSQLGLDNNSVVHCLIHQPRSSDTTPSSPPHTSNLPRPIHHQQQTTEDSIPRQPGQQSAAEAGIDIGGLLVPLIGVILGLVWYCRFAYASYFTAAATTGLVGLSGLCIFSVLIIWYPEPEAP